MRSESARMRKRAAEMERRRTAEVERLRRGASGGELVPYGAYRTELGPHQGDGVKVPVRRRSAGGR